MKNLSALIITLTMSLSAFPCSEDGTGGILPENNLKIYAGDKSAAGITEEEFMAAIEKVERIYSPIISDMGATLKIHRLWTNPTVNASAKRDKATPKLWEVNMYGGLARHKTITPDGFMLVLCHELGHHIGGAPKKSGFNGKVRWATNEGQADYWGTMKCLKRVLADEDNESIVANMNVSEAAKARCNSVYSHPKDQAICARSSMAGKSLANLFYELRKSRGTTMPEPKFVTPDPNRVPSTFHSHPEPQCRLDTYFQGSLCELDETILVSQEEPNQGNCNRIDGYANGIRPLCWYKTAN